MNQAIMPKLAGQRGRVKCLVWDLDNTLWQGILAEGDACTVLPEIRNLICELDQRGILQSIASRNDAQPALQRLRELALADYFLWPQIHWGPKSASVAAIAQAINIGLDTLAFIDDQPYERDEVAQTYPELLCLDVTQAGQILQMPEFMPHFITDESKQRRAMYRQDAVRQELEDNFAGPKEEFLAELNMVFSITYADEIDLCRLQELTARTNQLNTTGRIYSYDELDALRQSAQHDLWVAALDDKYGSYGKIGLALVEKSPELWTIRILLMSCRVLSRGVGTLLLQHIMRRACAAQVRLQAEMIPNERNRMMYATYKFAGFKEVASEVASEMASEVASDRSSKILEHDLQQVPGVPDYVQLHTPTRNGEL